MDDLQKDHVMDPPPPYQPTFPNTVDQHLPTYSEHSQMTGIGNYGGQNSSPPFIAQHAYTAQSGPLPPLRNAPIRPFVRHNSFTNQPFQATSLGMYTHGNQVRPVDVATVSTRPDKPKDFLCRSILTTIFCNLFLGLFALYFSFKVRRSYNANLYDRADHYSWLARIFYVLAFYIGVCTWIIFGPLIPVLVVVLRPYPRNSQMQTSTITPPIF